MDLTTDLTASELYRLADLSSKKIPHTHEETYPDNHTICRAESDCKQIEAESVSDGGSSAEDGEFEEYGLLMTMIMITTMILMMIVHTIL